MTEPVPVVAAALVRDGLLLAARRSAPHRFAGQWEFPGGKVEAGENEAQALERECAEELGVRIGVGPRLAEIADNGIRLVLFGAVVLDGDPEPIEDHDELRWLAPEALESVPWLPIDLALLPAVRAHLHEWNRKGRL